MINFMNKDEKKDTKINDGNIFLFFI